MENELELQTKECTQCKVRKLLSDFYKDKMHKDGHHSCCKKCFCKRTNAYKAKNKQKAKTVNRDLHLRKTFGIDSEQYKEILLRQHGVCAVCNKPETSMYRGKLRHLSVDHCHGTGKVRGLLCNDCNIALGWFKDDISRLESAIRYLESS